MFVWFLLFSGGVYWFHFGLPCFNGWRLAVSFVVLMYDGVWGGQGGWLGSWSYLEDIDRCLFMDKSHKSSFL